MRTNLMLGLLASLALVGASPTASADSGDILDVQIDAAAITECIGNVATSCDGGVCVGNALYTCSSGLCVVNVGGNCDAICAANVLTACNEGICAGNVASSCDGPLCVGNALTSCGQNDLVETVLRLLAQTTDEAVTPVASEVGPVSIQL